MPIPNEQAGKESEKSDPMNFLVGEIIEIANKRLRLEIDLEQWETERDRILRKYGYLK